MAALYISYYFTVDPHITHFGDRMAALYICYYFTVDPHITHFDDRMAALYICYYFTVDPHITHFGDRMAALPIFTINALAHFTGSLATSHYHYDNITQLYSALKQ